MYILSSDAKQIINSEYVERICIAEKIDAALIVLSYSSERPPVTLARYKDLQEAKEAMCDLYNALAGGQTFYIMPDSRIFAEETIKKDARIKRKGGS